MLRKTCTVDTCSCVYMLRLKKKRTARTLIITVCWPGTSFSGGSGLPHSGILFSSPIGVPSHLTSAEIVSLSASGFSGNVSGLPRLTGKPGDGVTEKKSVILVFCLMDPSELSEELWGCVSISPLPTASLEAGDTLFSSYRSPGVKGWVSSSESESEIGGFSAFRQSRECNELLWQPPSSVISTSSWVWHTSAVLALLAGVSNHRLRAFSKFCCFLWRTLFFFTPCKPSAPLFGRMFIFVPVLFCLLSWSTVSLSLVCINEDGTEEWQKILFEKRYTLNLS